MLGPIDHLTEKLGLKVEEGRVVQRAEKPTIDKSAFVELGFNRLLDPATHITFEKVGGELVEIHSDIHDAAKRFLEKHSSI